MNADGTSLTRLTNNSTGDAFPSCSPDGRQIVFESERDLSTGFSLYIMNSDGTAISTLTSDPGSEILPFWGR